MRAVRLASSLLAFMLTLAPARGNEPLRAPFLPSRYTAVMFEAALAKGLSTAPDYVLVTVRDGRSGASRLACVEANALFSALHREYGVGVDEAGRTELLRLALASPERTFTFSTPEALASVSAHYTPEVLARVRRRLSRFSEAELRRGEGLKWLEAFYMRPDFKTRDAYQEATAHVLLERGILCGRGDRGPTLFIEATHR